MGYYSYYSLDVDVADSKHLQEDIIADLISGNDEATSALKANGKTKNEAKWYQSDDDMKLFSEKYPDVIFALLRKGQVLGDIVKVYFKNGESQTTRPEIVYPDFDVQKLEMCVPQLIDFEEAVKLTILCESGFTASVIKDLRESYSEADAALSEDGGFCDGNEWPNYEADFMGFSKKHPDVLFTVFSEIEYEEEEVYNMNSLNDFSVKYFKNGNVQTAKAFWSFEDYEQF